MVNRSHAHSTLLTPQKSQNTLSHSLTHTLSCLVMFILSSDRIRPWMLWERHALFQIQFTASRIHTTQLQRLGRESDRSLCQYQDSWHLGLQVAGCGEKLKVANRTP